MPLIESTRLTGIARRVFAAAGSEEAEAGIVADHLVEANLKGHDSHGVGMIPSYLRNLGAGKAVANQGGRVVSDSGSIIDFIQNRQRLSLGTVRKELRPWIGMPSSQLPPYPALPKTSKDRLRVETEFDEAFTLIEGRLLEAFIQGSPRGQVPLQLGRVEPVTGALFTPAR